jgi:IS4 transposase
MLLGERFDRFVEESPVSVMVRGTLERVFDPAQLERVFETNAVLQYTKELSFSQCVHVMSDVVFQVSPTVGAWYQDHKAELPVTRQAVYDKLKHLELGISAAVVDYSAQALLPVVRRMKAQRKPLLPGYRVRILDGNHLAGTEHRILELRPHRAAALPGQALVLYDPRFDLITHIVPCEDAYTQERALLPTVLELTAARDCLVIDRNFCTLGFLFGLSDKKAFFVNRQHATLPFELKGRRHQAGTDEEGRPIYEQAACLTHPDTGETLTLRRITIPLPKPTRQGETEIHILTNLPVKAADAVKVAALYRDRWTVEVAFWHLSEELDSEINTLGYPKAALFGFAVAVVAYNVVSLVKCAMRAAWGQAFVEEQLSMYYLTLEVSRVSSGMMIAIPATDWDIFRTMTTAEFGGVMLELATHMNTQKYIKHKRGPKKKPAKKISGKQNHHVSTARILAMRTPK